MRFNEEQLYSISDQVFAEGEPELLCGPIEQLPPTTPPQWRRILSDPDPRAAALELWRSVSDRMPRACRGLHERLHRVAMLCTEERPASLLYFFRDGADWFIYRGGESLADVDSEAGQVPDELRPFYAIHDGWTLLFSGDDGPAPSSEFQTVAELFPDIKRWSPSGLARSERLLVVFRDGEEVGLAVDPSEVNSPAFICAADGTIEPLLDLWAEMDRRIGGFLAELDPVEPNAIVADANRNESDERADQRCARVLASYERVKSAAPGLIGSFLHEQAAEISLQRAWIAARRNAPENAVNEHLRLALEVWCIGIERSLPKISPDELQATFGLAHHLGAAAPAAFIATVPRELWQDETPDAIATAILFDRFLGDDSRLLLQAEQLEGMPPDVDSPAPAYTRIVVGLAVALARGDANGFRAWRQQAIEEEPVAPTDIFADFPWSIRIKAFDAVAAQLGI